MSNSRKNNLIFCVDTKFGGIKMKLEISDYEIQGPSKLSIWVSPYNIDKVYNSIKIDGYNVKVTFTGDLVNVIKDRKLEHRQSGKVYILSDKEFAWVKKIKNKINKGVLGKSLIVEV